MLATRGGSRTPGLYHDSDTRRGLSQRWRHEEAAAHGLNHRWRHEDAAGHRVCTTIVTRGRRPPQHANSEQVVDRRECGRPPGGLAHQSRRRARDFGKSPRNLMPGSEPVWGNGLGQRFGATVRHNLSARPSGRRPRVATRGGCRPQPESSQRRKTGSQAVFRTDGYLTTGLDTTA